MKFTISKDGIVNHTQLFSDDNTTQQYVRTAIHAVLQEMEVKVVEEWEMDDDSIEITLTG